MKTMITFATALALSVTALACSGSPDPQNGDAPGAAASATEPLINQGRCTTEQLLEGWFEVDGQCYGPSTGGGGGGGGGTACVNKCNSNFDRCSSRCDQHGGSTTCYSSCDRGYSICTHGCP